MGEKCDKMVVIEWTTKRNLEGMLSERRRRKTINVSEKKLGKGE
jgi:hypothetical protein